MLLIKQTYFGGHVILWISDGLCVCWSGCSFLVPSSLLEFLEWPPHFCPVPNYFFLNLRYPVVYCRENHCIYKDQAVLSSVLLSSPFFFFVCLNCLRLFFLKSQSKWKKKSIVFEDFFELLECTFCQNVLILRENLS